LGKYNQARFASDFSVDIKQIEYAVPGPASPSKKVVLVILSGMISFFFCVVTLFLLFFFDDHIRTTQELANKSGLAVLGSIPLISKAMLDLKKIWNSNETSPGEDEYITWMRSLRFEVDAAMGDKKVLAITSMQNGEGKTFVSLGLAYAYARINKKILVIDGCFDKPDISETIRSEYYLEDVFSGKTDLQHFETEKNITILANRGNNFSLFELLDKQSIRNTFQQLEERFDLIMIETCELGQEGKIKEWVSVSDRVLAVFESDQNIPLARKKNITYLQSLNDTFIGWVLNKVKTQKNKRKRLW
jgi:Mrp family chromosome partitioning ATPase